MELMKLSLTVFIFAAIAECFGWGLQIAAVCVLLSLPVAAVCFLIGLRDR